MTFISPCILPLLPVYVFYLAGVSGNEQVKRGKLLVNSIGFVIGFTLVFTLLGATATSLGSYLQRHVDIFKRVSGIVMVIFGLHFIGLLRLSFLNFQKSIDYQFKELKFLNAIIFGMALGFSWTTSCAGTILGSVLVMAANSGTVVQGILLLLVYSAGLGVPFILTSLFFDSIRDTFRQLQRHGRIISIISGIVLIMSGVLVFLKVI